ncbi:hypothetical protein [Mycolicibacter arupensis]|jgi:hypothetical protein|uniref:ParB/Sulfiredoxin domain-containing protein n=1 Tax=Mycolicibacter arupensis TaxID=342002 RepID=A0A0F5MUM2_9MYCO|nr:hypothetical protein [Mycolicibacter arupensis]KKB98294.1 hypothetical protein WR43_15240 [Mycolicibacter arupensis]OQZ94384.1 hypothetical protein BST15_16585 [Mycolicibacter arupensis]
MTAAAQWPIIEVSLDDLRLDVGNVRLTSGDLEEADIASYLAEAEDLVGLARDLLRDGYIDNEIPIVVEEDGGYVVMEANRRIAALKAIHDPMILGRHAAQLERHLTRYPGTATPTVVRVMVAPSREAAQPVLARLHTGQPKRSWIREQQAIFYHARLSDTVTVDDLRARYPREAGKIVSFIRMGEMRELIRGVRYDDSDLEGFVKSSQLKMTSLEYAYERPRIRALLGLEFDDQGLLKSRRLTSGQHRGLMYLLGRFKDGTLNTRSPELKERDAQHAALVEQLRRIVDGDTSGDSSDAADGEQPDHQNSDDGSEPDGDGGRPSGGAGDGGGGGAPSGDGGPGGDDASPTGVGSRGPNRGDTRSRLDFTGFDYQGSSAGLRRRLEELRKLNVLDFPNAAMDLTRTVLECAIKVYFSGKGTTFPAGKGISYCVDELAKDFRSDQRMTALINVIKRKGSMTANQYAGTSFALNASNHEPEAFASTKDVHEAWERIKPILVEIAK